ncbi:alpha/beta hydrolase [Alteribacillus sp. HJP-4]|uniref:alpha/beta hydrolase n=1 Tax=Alteribacillus sp. HJP-4 TaxID=2775394 RepID=UPI0035CCD628
MADIEFQYVKTNGITLHTAAAGPNDGPLVVLLHGFPEFWYGWKTQMESLANDGYRVLAPDQRGYNKSDKPSGIDSYTLNQLRDDITGLIDLYHRDQAVIIGHDWGGAVGWHIAATRPEYVKSFIPVNIPHPAVMARVSAAYPVQWMKSAYMVFFQLPDKPELALRSNDFQVLAQFMQNTSQPNTFSDEDMEKYKEAWKQPHALTAMLNWYRAIRRGGAEGFPFPKVRVPTRLIWGKDDSFLSVKLAKETLKICDEGELILVDEATHWVHHEHPDIMDKLIKEFLVEKMPV